MTGMKFVISILGISAVLSLYSIEIKADRSLRLMEFPGSVPSIRLIPKTHRNDASLMSHISPFNKKERTNFSPRTCRMLKVSDSQVVAAIDFGTTYSGWAYSFRQEFRTDPTSATVSQWKSDSLTTEMTPTTVLIQPDGETLDAFGYAAENRYRMLVNDGTHQQYFYFKHIKLVLNKTIEETFDRNMPLEDEMGRSLQAIDVFVAALQYLKNDLIQNITPKLTKGIETTDIHWVFSVPAIWTDRAKQFMREAANKTGICHEKLTIALAPDAASVYYRNMPRQAVKDASVLTVTQFKKGTQYILLSAGGSSPLEVVQSALKVVVSPLRDSREILAVSPDNRTRRSYSDRV